MDVRLAGQVVAAPRWQNPSVELATLRAVYNAEEIAFLVEWDDPFEDVVHREDQEFDPKEIAQPGAYNSYVEANDMVPRQLETFRDAVALQFPVKPPQGTRRPHFLRGGSSDPVNLWLWKADRAAAGEPAAEEAVARGWKQAPTAQPAEQQQAAAEAAWAEGRWRVVIKRPLTTEDKNDVQFVPGLFIPLALNVWDGSNGEHGRIMSVSSWYSVFIEAPTPISVYVYAVLAALAAAALCFWLVRKAEKSAADTPNAPTAESES
jgi:DMSO reductase family type II enzyme heme b subunit